MTPDIIARSRDHKLQPKPSHDQSGAACVIAGTILLTQDGEIPVDYLAAGDRIITHDAGLVTLHSVERTRCWLPAVQITAGSLGDMRPEDDLILPAAQTVLIRDWRAQAMFGVPQAVVEAGALVDGAYVLDQGLRSLDICVLRFDHRHVIYAGGLELACTSRANVLRQAA